MYGAYDDVVVLYFNFKEIVKKCKQNVSDHEEFNERCDSATKWLEKARQKYDTYTTLKGGRDDIEAKRAVIQVVALIQILLFCVISAVNYM